MFGLASRWFLFEVFALGTTLLTVELALVGSVSDGFGSGGLKVAPLSDGATLAGEVIFEISLALTCTPTG